MGELIKIIQNIPVPTMLIMAGLFFLLLGFINKLGGIIEVSREQKKWSILIGLLILTIGLVIYFANLNAAGDDCTPKIPCRTDEVQAVINDPDGYTKVRSGQGTQHNVIAKVFANEVFYTTPQQSDWWRVRTKDNKCGYIHRSRIRVQK